MEILISDILLSWLLTPAAGDHWDHWAMFGIFTVPVCGQTNHKYRHIHNARHLNSNYWNNVLIKSQWSMFTVIISPFCADDSEKYFVHCLKSPPIYGGGEYGPAVAWLWCTFVTFAVRDTNMPRWRGARVTCHVVTLRDTHSHHYHPVHHAGNWASQARARDIGNCKMIKDLLLKVVWRCNVLLGRVGSNNIRVTLRD